MNDLMPAARQDGARHVACAPRQTTRLASHEMASDLNRRLPAAAVTITGIPVAAAFRRSPAQYRARMDAGLPADRRIVLVMGGGLGIGVEDSARAALDAGIPDLHVVAVCGRNEAVRQRLASLESGDERLRVIGYSSDIATLIAASDVVVTKPGGLTCSETLAVVDTVTHRIARRDAA